MRAEVLAGCGLRPSGSTRTNHLALRGRQLTEEQLAGVYGDDRLHNFPRGSGKLDMDLVSHLQMMAAVIHKAQPLSRLEPDPNSGHQPGATWGILSIICSIAREAPTFMSRRSAA